MPSQLEGYVQKVALYAYKVTDEDVEELKARGYSEDEIFEIAIAASLGAGLARVEKGGPLQLRATSKHLGFTNGPPAVLTYRPQFFGRDFGAGVRRALEGRPKEWNRGEMELFAAFVSNANRCKF